MESRWPSINSNPEVLSLTAAFSNWYLGITALFLAVLVAPVARSVLVIVAVIVALQIIGESFTAHLAGSVDNFSRNGIGFLVASVFVVEVNQLLLRISERGLSWWLVAGVAMLLKVRTKSRPRASHSSQVDSIDFLLITFFAVMGLASFTYFWLAPLALLTAALGWLRATHPRTQVVWIGFVVFAVSLMVIASWMRPRYWFLIQEEQIFYATLSSSLSRLTSSTSILGVTSDNNFHWLQYGLTGWLSRESLVDQIPIMSVILPILFSLVALGLCFSLLGLRVLSRSERLLSAVLLVFFLYRMGIGNGARALNMFISPAVSASLAYCSGLFDLLTRSDRAKPANLCLLALLAYGAIGSYTTTAMAPLLGATSALLVAILLKSHRRQTRVNLVAAAVITASSMVALLRFTGFPFAEIPDGARVGVFPFLGFVEAQSREIYSLRGMTRVAAKLGYFSGLSAPLLLAVLVLRRSKLTLLSIAVALTMTFGALLLSVTHTNSYADQLPIATGTYLFAVPILVKHFVINVRLRLSALWPAVIAIVTWFVWLRLHFSTRHLGNSFSIGFRYVAYTLPVLLGVLPIILAIFLHLFRTRSSSESRLGTLGVHHVLHYSLGAVLAFAVLQGGYAFVEGYGYYNHRYETRGSTLEPSSETIDAANWMRTNSSRADLYAVDQANSDLEIQNLLRVSGRRILAIGPTLWAKDFRLVGDGPRLLQLQRQLSVPTLDLLRDLAVERVTHIVLRREISSVRFKELFGLPEFQNSRWVIYDLASLRIR